MDDEIDEPGNTLKLKKDYAFNPSTDPRGILVDRDNYVIDGDGHTINGMGKSAIFIIEANNVTIKNINLINGNTTDLGAAISFDKLGSVENCNFTNNQAYRGGAIYFYKSGTVSNCHFTDNQAKHGGAISFNGIGTVQNSIFESNNANTDYGGAIELQSEGSVFGCNFTNNKAIKDGGAVYSSVNANVDNCLFNNNTATFGGSIYLKKYGTILNSIFNNNTATTDGGAIDLIENGIINNCNFTDNKAYDDGGAVNIHKNGTVRMSHFENNKAADYGGAIQIENGILLNNDFISNIARYGGAIYLIQNASITNNRFKNNHVNGSGGAIYIEKTGVIDQSEFEKNTANIGGAIFDNGHLDISNSNFNENDATDGTDNVALGNTATITSTNNTPEELGPYHAAHMEITSITDSIIYEDKFTIRVYVSANNNPLNDGNATIVFGDKTATSRVVNGYATIEIERLPAGTWTTYVQYANSDYVAKLPVTVTVKQRDAVIYVLEAKNIIYGETVEIRVSLIIIETGTMNEGNISLTVDGRNFTSEVKNGFATIEIPDLNVGNYTTQIFFDDENYNTLPVNVKFSVNERPVTLNVTEAENINYTETFKIKVDVTFNGVKLNEGNVSTIINGRTYTANVENGVATVEIPDLEVGKYACQIMFNGGETYSKPTADIEFEVMPTSAELKSHADSIIYGDVVKINANVTVKGIPINEGNISTTINGKVYTVKVQNGRATIEIPNLNVGIYPVTVVFDSSKNYKATSQEITFDVYQQLVSISVIEVENITYGETAKVKVSFTVNGNPLNEGNVSASIGNQTYTAKVENGLATIEIPNLKAGKHSFTVMFDGGANYNKPTADVMLEVMILTVEIDVDVENTTYGNTLKINATVSADGRPMNEGIISTIINGQTYTAKVENGKATIEVSGLEAGLYECKVTYDDEGNTNTPYESICFEILKESVDIEINVVDNTYGKPAKIILNITINGKGVNEGCVLTVLEKKYQETTDPQTGAVEIEEIILRMKNATANNGYATVEIPILDVGSYPCSITFDGGRNLNNQTKEFVLDIVKQNSQIIASNNAYVINYGGKYSITLKDIEGKFIIGEKVTFILNGKNLGSAVTNANGIATITLTANTLKTIKSGAKNLVIKFENKNYNTATKTVKITVNKEKTKIVAKKKTFKKGKKGKYSITLKNSKGKAVNKVKTTLKIKGKTYKAKTNSKGKATFKIKLTKKGTFKSYIKFKGNSYYKSASKKVKLKFK